MKNLIGNSWVESSDGKVIDIINPATNELISTVPNSTVEDVNGAVEEAYRAQKNWQKVPMHERGRILKNYIDLVEKESDDLAKLLCAETGKPIKEARAEIANVRIFVEGYIEKAKHLYGINIPEGIEKGQENTIQYTKRYPLGVVACIIPFNFPSDLFHQKVPSALIMGNSVIVKPSTYNPLTLIKFVDLLRRAGVPEGVIEVVNGDGPVVGQALARHPKVHLISVTGSTKVGMETMGSAATHLAHVMLELGGNDAFILHKDGDVDLAVKEAVWGRLYNTGQVCCASKRFLIHKDIKDEFIRKAIAKISTLRVGMPLDESTDIGLSLIHI